MYRAYTCLCDVQMYIHCVHIMCIYIYRERERDMYICIAHTHIMYRAHESYPKGEMIRLGTLIELGFLNLSCSSLSPH